MIKTEDRWGSTLQATETEQGSVALNDPELKQGKGNGGPATGVIGQLGAF